VRPVCNNQRLLVVCEKLQADNRGKEVGTESNEEESGEGD
jgi:hypothetical protein